MKLRSGFVGVAMASALMAAPALAQDLAFTLTNNSGVDLTEFYASPVGVDSWEEDILGGAVLPAGSSGQVTIGDARDVCDYDLRMVFADGDVIEQSGNLCETGSYTIN
ncbi:hypothetical protein [Rhodobacter ferrooxidans]|uniref:Uncharacterized protein n=1 Tax=Rhodobacter ferrooxidans TaxID=371731 RepID=C8RXC0_9RHOB|nr:hypothetical protein [Rhodobacter sp. SW2]EEW26645.1 conserved hypothetical protein [Rhodobacter sp. SW2]